MNKTLQIQMDAIRSVYDDIEKVESIILQKKAQLKNSKDVHESDRLLAELDGLAATSNSKMLLRTTRNNSDLLYLAAVVVYAVGS
jgi:hypothetical protein